MSTTIRLCDNRTMTVHQFGDPAGQPVMFFHGSGFGATGLFAAACDAAAKAMHYRIIAPDRPGLGGSSPHPGRTIADFAGDIGQIADALNLGMFPAVAHSGGAAYALCCAGHLQNRIYSVHLASPVVPRYVLMRGTAVPFLYKLKTACFAAIPDVILAAMFRNIVKGMWKNPPKAETDFLRRLPRCEREQLADADTLALLREAAFCSMSQGPGPLLQDFHHIMGNWDFPLHTVRQPVSLWHGERDSTTLPQAARSLARTLPAAQVHMIPDAGHLAVWLRHARDILKGIGIPG